MRLAVRRLITFYGLQLRLLRTWRLGPLGLLRRLVLTGIVGWVAFAAAIYIVPGVSADGPASILGAIALIALLNTLIRPIVLWLAMPLGIVGVGVVGTVLQVVVVLVAGAVVPGIHVTGWPAAIEGAVVFSLLNAAIVWLVALGEEDSYFAHLVRLLIRGDAPAIDQPGVVFIQIDGLSEPVLANQMRAGRVPTLSRWLRDGSHTMTAWRCRLPSQTSASQAGILLGANDGIPAFRWYEKATGHLMVSNRAADAAEIERRLATDDGLLRGGTSIGNLFSGGAAESILTMSRLSDPATSLGPTRSWFYFFVSPFAFARAISLSLGEMLKEVWQARRQRAAGIEPRIDRGGAYPVLRATTNVLLRQVTASLLVERILRGVPVIYVDFVDYDEIAHHSGPERGDALDALDGIDGVIGSLERVAAEAPRPYRFVVLSDHGQSLGATFRQRSGTTLETVVRELMGDGAAMVAATTTAEPWGPASALLTELGRVPGLAGGLVRRATKSRSRSGSVELGPGRAVAQPPADGRAGGHSGVGMLPGLGMPSGLGPSSGAGEAGGRPDLVVCASGNLALVYVNASEERMTMEELDRLHPRLLAGLASHPGIGFVLVRSARVGPVALGPHGRHVLEGDAVSGEDPLAPFGADAADDLRRLDAMPNVGDLVINSAVDASIGEVAAFEELVGSHGGLGGRQTEAFLLHPSDWPGPVGPLVGAPAVHGQLVAWLEAVGLRDEPAVDRHEHDVVASPFVRVATRRW
jgi:uncharacterized membrane protein YvlD (DUF360 family)